jgi:hypothetical protein
LKARVVSDESDFAWTAMEDEGDCLRATGGTGGTDGGHGRDT